MKLTNQEVFEIVEEEQSFAKQWDIGRSKFPESVADAEKPLEVWLLWMEQYLADARKAATASYDKTRALDRLRCVLSLGLNAAVYHGLPRRNA